MSSGPMIQFCTSDSASTPLVAEDLAQLLVADLRQRRVHHQDEADRDGDRGRAHAHAVERGREAGRQSAERDAQAHRGEDPQREVAVEEGELAEQPGSNEYFPAGKYS
jgi:hypothetical protein